MREKSLKGLVGITYCSSINNNEADVANNNNNNNNNNNGMKCIQYLD